MTDTEAIEAVRGGGRAVTEFSLHGDRRSGWHSCRHFWRCIACDGGETDVIECAGCGEQRLAKCDFDEDFA